MNTMTTEEPVDQPGKYVYKNIFLTKSVFVKQNKSIRLAFTYRVVFRL